MNIYVANKIQERRRGKLEAVREASLMRLRPVSQMSLATVATIVTLFVVPALYVLIAKGRRAREVSVGRVCGRHGEGLAASGCPEPAHESHRSARETTERGGAIGATMLRAGDGVAGKAQAEPCLHFANAIRCWYRPDSSLSL